MKRLIFLLSVTLTSVAVFAQNDKLGSMSASEFKKTNQKGAAMVAAIKPTGAALSAADQALLFEIAEGGKRQLKMSRAALSSVDRADVKMLAQSEVEEQTGIAAKLSEIAAAKGVKMPDTSASAMPAQGMGAPNPANMPSTKPLWDSSSNRSMGTQGDMSAMKDSLGKSGMNQGMGTMSGDSMKMTTMTADRMNGNINRDTMKLNSMTSDRMNTNAGSDSMHMNAMPSDRMNTTVAADSSRTGSSMNGAAADIMYLTESGVKGHKLLETTMLKVSAQAKDPALKALAAATLPVIRTHLMVSQELLKQPGTKMGAKK